MMVVWLRFWKVNKSELQEKREAPATTTHISKKRSWQITTIWFLKSWTNEALLDLERKRIPGVENVISLNQDKSLRRR